MMSVSLYRDIIKTVQATNLRECQDILEQKYPTVSVMTLGSILSNYIQKQMKINHSKHNTPEKMKEYYYRQAVKNKEESGIILRISDEIRITPVLVARFILEAYLVEQHEQNLKTIEEDVKNLMGTTELLQEVSTECDKLVGVENSEDDSEPPNTKPLSRSELKAEINKLLRDTSLISDRDLAFEVYLCTVNDDNYGPLPDAIKRTVGKEYENRLSQMLHDQGILYLEEDQLRKQGYDKTPDFKLEAPVAVNGKVVTWIESKATFGDEETHQIYVKDQLKSYFNRFGPGIVIYWLGYVETIQNSKTKGIFVYDHLPTSITKYDPNVSIDSLKL